MPIVSGGGAPANISTAGTTVDVDEFGDLTVSGQGASSGRIIAARTGDPNAFTYIDSNIGLYTQGGSATVATSGGVVKHDLSPSQIGFFGHATVGQQTGVAVTAAAIHAALVAYGLITA